MGIPSEKEKVNEETRKNINFDECISEGCHKILSESQSYRKTDYCKTHYRAYIDPYKPRKRNICIYDDCDKTLGKARKTEYCFMHLNQIMRKLSMRIKFEEQEDISHLRGSDYVDALEAIHKKNLEGVSQYELPRGIDGGMILGRDFTYD